MKTRYVIALGSNVRHVRHGRPEAVLAAAFASLAAAKGIDLQGRSPISTTAPLGPSRRRYANAAAIVRSKLDPPALLRRLEAIERQFGRRRRGARWRERVLDLDLILWSGGAWSSPGLTIPHPEFRTRAFVLIPAAAIAPDWRDPLTGLRPTHLLARLTRPRQPPR